MEILSLNSSHDEIAEAIRGFWGKDIMSDCSFAYCGTIVFGFGKSIEILNKNCKCSHYDWEKIGDDVYIAIIK